MWKQAFQQRQKLTGRRHEYMLRRRYPSPLGNVISPSSSSRGKRSKGSNFILLNGEQRTPDAAVVLVADKENLLQQILNAKLKSRKQFPSDSLLQPDYLLYFLNTAIRHLVNEYFPNGYNALWFFCSHSDGYTSIIPNLPSNLKAHVADTNDNLQVFQA